MSPDANVAAHERVCQASYFIAENMLQVRIGHSSRIHGYGDPQFDGALACISQAENLPECELLLHGLKSTELLFNGSGGHGESGEKIGK